MVCIPELPTKTPLRELVENAKKTMGEVVDHLQQQSARLSGKEEMSIQERRLASFLYELLRDELPAGTVEKLVQNVEKEPLDNEMVYTNKGLEFYANGLAKRLLLVEHNFTPL